MNDPRWTDYELIVHLRKAPRVRREEVDYLLDLLEEAGEWYQARRQSLWAVKSSLEEALKEVEQVDVVK